MITISGFHCIITKLCLRFIMIWKRRNFVNAFAVGRLKLSVTFTIAIGSGNLSCLFQRLIYVDDSFTKLVFIWIVQLGDLFNKLNWIVNVVFL